VQPAVALIIGVRRVSQQPASTSETIASIAPAVVEPASVQPPVEEDKKEKKDKKKKKKEERNRGTDTMFRVTYQNHISLSQLADNKAHVLISMNGAIVGILIGLLTPRFGTLSWLFTPAVLLILTCTVSLAFAVLALRPRLGRTPLTVEQIESNQGNALFFGQFTSLQLEDFHTSMRMLMKDEALAYDALTRQLYSMGHALLRKYRSLQIAYTVFLVGVTVSVLIFAGLLVLFGFAD
jgi:hypothetical protein